MTKRQQNNNQEIRYPAGIKIMISGHLLTFLELQAGLPYSTESHLMN